MSYFFNLDIDTITEYVYIVCPYPSQRAPGPLLLKRSPHVPADVQSESNNTKNN